MANSAIDSPARILAMSALGATTTTDDILVDTAVGKIPVGAYYAAGTPLQTIINDMFFGNTNVTYYLGSTDNPATSETESGMSPATAKETDLVNPSGMTILIKSGRIDPTTGGVVWQYPAVALPKTATEEYVITHWQALAMPGVDMPFTQTTSSGYNIYRLTQALLDFDLGGTGFIIIVEKRTI